MSSELRATNKVQAHELTFVSPPQNASPLSGGAALSALGEKHYLEWASQFAEKLDKASILGGAALSALR